MYAILVLRYNISPDYVLNHMQLYEARALLKYSDYSSRDSWEQSRLVAYLIAQVNSTKKLRPTDILKFKWDDEEHIGISNDEIERLRNKAKTYEQNKNIDIDNNG